MTQAHKELSHKDPEFLPVQYDMQAAKIRKLKKEYDPKLIPEANAKGDDGYLIVHEKAMAIVKVRTGIEKVRKTLNADAVAWTKTVNTEAKRLTAIVEELEAPWREVKNTLDEKEAREAEAARVKEQQRMEAIEQRISNIRKMAEGLIGVESSLIKSRLDEANAIEIDGALYEDYTEAAEHAKSTVVLALTAAYEERLNFEQQQELLRKQQEEMAEQQRKLDEQQAIIDKAAAEKQAEADRIEGKRIAEEALEQKAEEDRIAAEQTEAEPVEAKPEAVSEVAPTSEPQIDYEYYRKSHDSVNKAAAHFMREHEGTIDDYSIGELIEWSYLKTQEAA